MTGDDELDFDYDLDLLAISVGLEKARSKINGIQTQGLRASTKARLFAAIDEPTDERWEDVYAVVIGPNGRTTFWQAVLDSSDYDVYAHHPKCPWPSIPTRDQLINALAHATRDET